MIQCRCFCPWNRRWWGIVWRCWTPPFHATNPVTGAENAPPLFFPCSFLSFPFLMLVLSLSGQMLVFTFEWKENAEKGASLSAAGQCKTVGLIQSASARTEAIATRPRYVHTL
jgi:hypothetical protein